MNWYVQRKAALVQNICKTLDVNNIREKMNEKQIEPNTLHSRVMIDANKKR